MKKTEELKTPQAVNEDNLHFLQRVDNYQFNQGVRRAQACRKIGISEGRLSEIRNFKVPVSDKMWRKLEAAEKAAGIAPAPKSQAYRSPFAEPPLEVRESLATYPIRTAADIAFRAHGDTPAGQIAFECHAININALRDIAEANHPDDLIAAVHQLGVLTAAYLEGIKHVSAKQDSSLDPEDNPAVQAALNEGKRRGFAAVAEKIKTRAQAEQKDHLQRHA